MQGCDLGENAEKFPAFSLAKIAKERCYHYGTYEDLSGVFFRGFLILDFFQFFFGTCSIFVFIFFKPNLELAECGPVIDQY